ncbi:hypothetical protein DVH05_013559 [Phytophthora capsici]|nr:hypothetical protein DVH05_013559 [Phytophthora capsici]
MSNPTLPLQICTRPPQDAGSFTNKLESPSRYASGSSRPSSAAKRSGLLQLHDGGISISTQEIMAVTPRKSLSSTPVNETKDNPHVQSNETPTPKPALPPRNVPLSPIRQLSERIKVHDDGALPIRTEVSPKGAIPVLPIRQPSRRLLVNGDGNIAIRRDSAVMTPIVAVAMTSEVVDTWKSTDRNSKEPLDHQLDGSRRSESNDEHGADIPDISSSIATEPEPHTPISRFAPLHSQWTYGQRIFGRYKKTPYFYSGNIATYLGAGMFMVVFDDGTLDYRVRREDIMLREHRKHRQDEEKSLQRSGSGSFHRDSFQMKAEDDSNSKSRRKSQQKLGEESEEQCLDPSMAPEMHLPPLQHLMVDFSVTPPKEMVLSFDDSGVAYDVGLPACGATHVENETWRLLLDDETLTMKRLECGVGYEDDSTQVSDSGESSEDDMMMTPWQQMTQTFGMGKAARPQRGNGRRSSISSVSQVDRLSVTQKSMKQIIPTPRSLKQVITEYFLRGNKKVQPSKPTEELALAEHIRLMEAKLNMMRSTRCNAGPPLKRGDCDNLRVVYERSPEGIRAYGTVSKRVEDGSYAVVTEDEHGISAQMVPQDMVDFLPSVNELEQQLTDLERTQRVFFAGQRVQVSLYPGSRFSGRGLITLEREYQSRFHVLLANRIRLANVPVDKISPLVEKKRAAVTITEDQFLVCSNKVKVYIGDQIYVKCSAGNGDFDSTCEDEKLGLLNGVYSNKTAAVDFADGSTGYEIPPQLIFKRKRRNVPADQDVRSLKNAVLMQASAAHGGGKEALPVLEEGYQVKADHPRKAAVESCIVIKTHASSACDLRFSDGTIAFEVFPSQMIIDSVEHQRTANTHTNETSNRAQYTPVFAVGDYVLAWSSRFGRYCSAKIVAKTSQDPSNGPASSSSPTAHVIAIAAVQTELYKLVFDYGELKAHMSPDKITTLDDMAALYHTQRLTNYSIDTMGFELSPVSFTVGELVMGRVHGTARYFNGVVESVDEKERVCAVCFDSSERDTAVPFSAMFSIDSRPHLASRSSSTKQVGGGASSSSEAASRTQFLSRQRSTETTAPSEANSRRRRHSSSSMGNMLKSVTDNLFRSSRSKRNLDTRRGSHMITEIGAHLRLEEQ